MHSERRYPNRLPRGFIAGSFIDSDRAEILAYVEASVRAAGLPELGQGAPLQPLTTESRRRGAGPQPPHPEE